MVGLDGARQVLRQLSHESYASLDHVKIALGGVRLAEDVSSADPHHLQGGGHL